MVAPLSGCYRTKTQTVLIKPPPCEVAAWPEDPDAYIYATDEEGKWTIYQADYLKVVFWMRDVKRIFEDLKTCPGVHFNLVPELPKNELLP